MAESSSHMTAAVDEQSLRLWKRGNLRGYNELVERYKRPIFCFIYHQIRDADEAKDILQETFIRMYRHKDRLREDKNLKAWLYQTASRLCIDLYRKKKPDRVFPMDSQDPAFTQLCDQSNHRQVGPQPDRLVEEHQAQQKILEAINRLPKKQRMIMSLRSCEGLSLSEIAETMECSEKTVGTTLFAARKKLVKWLKPLYEELWGSFQSEWTEPGGEE